MQLTIKLKDLDGEQFYKLVNENEDTEFFEEFYVNDEDMTLECHVEDSKDKIMSLLCEEIGIDEAIIEWRDMN